MLTDVGIEFEDIVFGGGGGRCGSGFLGGPVVRSRRSRGCAFALGGCFSHVVRASLWPVMVRGCDNVLVTFLWEVQGVKRVSMWTESRIHHRTYWLVPPKIILPRRRSAGYLVIGTYR